MTIRKTKIVCSLGPTTEPDGILEKMIGAGMNVARFNFSHGSHEEHKDRMEKVRAASAKMKMPVALMMDTKGPEIRSGVVSGGGTVAINAGDSVIVTADDAPVVAVNGSEPAHISMNWKELPQKVKPGVKILVADGLLELDVISTDGTEVKCVAANTAVIGSKKNVNLIGIHAGLPIMSEQDKADIAFCAKMECDYVAASFVSTASEVHEMRRYINSLGSKMKIIAKIENELGLNNIDEIVQAADGIMVARGDLGVQLPTEKIPLAQKTIIRAAKNAGKPVITATQMLDSMIVNPRPTRAELTDVANAVFDGTDAVMLSGETANGKYPVEAVETLARIVSTVENSEEFYSKMRDEDVEEKTVADGNIGKIMSRIAYSTARDVSAKAIIAPTISGHTARLISGFRPEQPVIAVTPDAVVARQLLLNWGVIPLHAVKADDSDEMIQNAIKTTLDAGIVNISDRIVMAAGVPLFSPLMLNTVRVMLVGNIIARGYKGGCSDSVNYPKVSGRVLRAETPIEARSLIGRKLGEILVCPHLTEDFIPLLRIVDGVVVEHDSEIPDSILKLVNPRLVWLSETQDAMERLESGLSITIDSSQLIVYEGTV